MDTKLLGRLTQRMPSFNGDDKLDILSGDFLSSYKLSQGFKPGELTVVTGMTSDRPRPSTYTLLKLFQHIRETKPDTKERWGYAVQLFRAMGQQVTWDDHSVAPKVMWFNFEGDGEETAEMIQQILHGEYEPPKPSPALSEIVNITKSMAQSGRNEGMAMVFDSYSEPSPTILPQAENNLIIKRHKNTRGH